MFCLDESSLKIHLWEWLDTLVSPHILSSSTLPPYSQGEVQPPLVVMRHPSYDSSDPWFVLHLGKKRQHAGDSAVDYLTTETDEPSVFLRLYTRSAPGCSCPGARWCAPCPILRALSQEGECAWKPGHNPRTGVTLGEATIQGRLYPGHTTGRCCCTCLQHWWYHTNGFQQKSCIIQN